MNGEIFKLAEAVEVLLTSRISVFFIAMLATILNFEFLRKVPTKIKEKAAQWSIVFGGINGLIIAGFYEYIQQISSIGVMLMIPLILVLELRLISEDSYRSYVRILFKCIFNFSCIYWGVSNVLGMITVEYLTKEIVFSLTLLIVSGWTYHLCFSKRFSMTNYKTIIHEVAAGRLFFRYFVIFGAFFLFTWNYKVFTLSEYMDMRAQRMFCGEMLLKVIFIWWSSRLLFVMITNQLSYVKNEVYTENILDKERAFRNTVMRKGIYSLNIDVTRDEIKEGVEYLNEEAWKNGISFRQLLTIMIEKCIHPEDEEEFVHTNDRQVIRERVDSAPYYSHQIRVSPKQMVTYFSLGEQLTKRYQETEKEWVWLKCDYIYTRDSMSGDVYCYIAVFDVDLQVEQGEKLKQSASTDFLTGILNRATMERRIEEQLRRKAGAGVFFIIDVDNFKSVNDILGHPMGDQLLKQIASILQELFRKDDFVGRLGGDEFCAFMKDDADLESVKAKAEMLNEKCRIDCKGEQGEVVKVSVSIGIACCEPQITEYSELYKYADLALYETKRKGKDTYTIYSKGM